MTRIVCKEDCGNSPKKLLLKEINIALARRSNAFVLRQLTDDVVWEWVGAAPLQGKPAAARMLESRKPEILAELVIEHIVTHGPAGAVNGTFRLANGRPYGFCHVFEFSGAKGARLKRITSYEIGK